MHHFGFLRLDRRPRRLLLRRQRRRNSDRGRRRQGKKGCRVCRQRRHRECGVGIRRRPRSDSGIRWNGALECVTEFLGSLEALRGILLETAERDGFERGRNRQIRPAPRGRLRRVIQVHDQNGWSRPGIERDLADQHLVEDHAEGVEVGAAVHRLSHSLLGCHVLRSAERVAVGCQLHRAYLPRAISRFRSRAA